MVTEQYIFNLNDDDKYGDFDFLNGTGNGRGEGSLCYLDTGGWDVSKFVHWIFKRRRKWGRRYS